MITISDDFKKSVSSNEREMKGYVEVTYKVDAKKEDYSLDRLNSIEELFIPLGSSQDWTNTSQIFDDDRKGKQYATLEKDLFKLDGTFVLPNNQIDQNPGIGYISNDIYEKSETEFKNNGYVMNAEYSSVPMQAITIYFQDNPPLDISLELIYWGDDEEQHSKIVKPESSYSGKLVQSVMFEETRPVTIKLYINDVLYPEHRVRIQEIDFGLSILYEAEELMSFKTIEQCDRLANEMATNECTIEIGDYNDNFDAINPKGMVKYLNDGVQIKPYVGVVTEDAGIEYCPMGLYYLETWDKSAEKVTFTAKDIFCKLNGDDYSIKKYDTSRFNKLTYSSYLSEKATQWNITIENLVDDDSDYIITNDSSGEKIGIPMNFVSAESKLLSLQKYCTAFGNTITSNRTGGLKYISSLKHKIQPVKITKDVLKDYQTIESKSFYKTITVVESQYAGTNNQGDDTQFTTLFTKTIECNGITEFKFTFDKVEWISPLKYTYSGSGTPMLLSSNIDVNTIMQFAKQIYMKFNYVGSITITAEGAKDIFTLNSYENSKSFNEDGEEVKIDNDFLSYLTMFANTVDEQSEAIINYRNNNQNKLTSSFSYNGNPATEVGDVIQVESKYSNNNEVKYDDVWVTKIESTFDGGFSQSIEGDIL